MCGTHHESDGSFLINIDGNVSALDPGKGAQMSQAHIWISGNQKALISFHCWYDLFLWVYCCRDLFLSLSVTFVPSMSNLAFLRLPLLSCCEIMHWLPVLMLFIKRLQKGSSTAPTLSLNKVQDAEPGMLQMRDHVFQFKNHNWFLQNYTCICFIYLTFSRSSFFFFTHPLFAHF